MQRWKSIRVTSILISSNCLMIRRKKNQKAEKSLVFTKLYMCVICRGSYTDCWWPRFTTDKTRKGFFYCMGHDNTVDFASKASAIATGTAAIEQAYQQQKLQAAQKQQWHVDPKQVSEVEQLAVQVANTQHLLRTAPTSGKEGSNILPARPPGLPSNRRKQKSPQAQLDADAQRLQNQLHELEEKLNGMKIRDSNLESIIPAISTLQERRLKKLAWMQRDEQRIRMCISTQDVDERLRGALGSIGDAAQLPTVPKDLILSLLFGEYVIPETFTTAQLPWDHHLQHFLSSTLAFQQEEMKYAPDVDPAPDPSMEVKIRADDAAALFGNAIGVSCRN
eukprot:GILK01012241.1.p1 GENE.GILK01012241.1~~GILK01012241.1.p1  ORF type:complete len:335 (-),score=36.17 GILK01012241.1:13-1017(-)